MDHEGVDQDDRGLKLVQARAQPSSCWSRRLPASPPLLPKKMMSLTPFDDVQPRVDLSLQLAVAYVPADEGGHLCPAGFEHQLALAI